MSLTSPTLVELKATLVQAFFGETHLARDLALSILHQHAAQAATTEELLRKVEAVPVAQTSAERPATLVPCRLVPSLPFTTEEEPTGWPERGE